MLWLGACRILLSHSQNTQRACSYEWCGIIVAILALSLQISKLLHGHALCYALHVHLPKLQGCADSRKQRPPEGRGRQCYDPQAVGLLPRCQADCLVILGSRTSLQLTLAPQKLFGGSTQGVKTVTSLPSCLSSLIRLENLIFMPETWLNGLGSTNTATFGLER